MKGLRWYLKYKLFLIHKLVVTLQRVLVVQVCLGLVMGIMLADLLGLPVTVAVGMGVFILGRRKLIWLSLSVLIGLGWYMLWFNPGRVEQIERFVGQTIILQGTVVQDPASGEIWQRLVLASDQLPQLVQLEVPNYPRLAIGDRVQTETKLEGLAELDSGYKNYLMGQGIFYIARSHDFSLIGMESSPWYVVGRLKTKFIAKVASVVDPPSSQVLLGLLVGGQGEFSPELKQQFVATGITHIFSVSGYNVGIVILGFLSLSGVVDRRLLVRLAMLGLLLFGIAVCPGNAAAVRAVIMGELVLFSLLLGRSKYLALMLLYAVTIMLLIYPLGWRNVSMQLSVAAMLGILFLRQVWEKYLSFLPAMIRETIVITLAVTLATMPVSLASFGGLSMISLPTNLLVLPILPLIMATGGLGVLLSYLVPFVSDFLLGVATWLINLALVVVRFLASIPGGYSEDMGANWVIFGLIVVVFIFLDYRLVLNKYALARSRSCLAES